MRRPFFRIVAFGLGLPALAALAPNAQANSANTTIRYGLSLAGLPIGTANVTFNFKEGGAYKIDASAKVGGLIALISDGRGSATATGSLGAAAPVPSSYALNSQAGKKPQTVQMALSSGNITAVELQPDLPPRADRVPVTAANKHGVMDPLSALLVPVPGGGEALSPAACKRNLPVFDGAQRFDVRLSYARTAKVEGNGYSGPAIVCSARYIPIAGHRPSRSQTKFMESNRDLELWLAPIRGTHVLAPWKIVVGTQIGRLSVDTVKFGGGDN